MHQHTPARSWGAPLVLGLITTAGFAQSGATRWTPPAISSDQYEYSAVFTPDGREMFFMRSTAQFREYRLLWSRCLDGTWSAPAPPAFAAPAPVLEADPFVTHDGRRIYFVSNRGKANPDDLDIWIAERSAAGSWSTPRRLPEPVNSTASELLPRVTANGRIYFGSGRPGGLGEMDIYVATASRNGTWRVENLGAPVNSAASEYEAEVARDERSLIVVADRGDRSHLYHFEKASGSWRERGRIAAKPEMFQVGLLLSPRADRLLFAQAEGARSGELFLIDLTPDPDRSWPPRCGEPTDTAAPRH